MAGLRRQLALTVAVQGSGAAATLGAALWIGLVLGPQQQGQFNALKSLVELGAALAMLGMPQALYVFAQRGRLAPHQARALAVKVAALGLPVGAALAWFTQGRSAGVALVLALAVALASLHGQWRALVLLAPRSLAFNLATVAPQWGLLVLAGAVIGLGGIGPAALAAGLALAWALGCAAAAQALAGVEPLPAQSATVLRDLARHGAATWLTTSLAAASIVVLQQAASLRSGSAGLGHVSLALMLAQVPLTPVNYALPILLRHRLRASAGSDLLRQVPWVAVPIAVLALVVQLVGHWRSDLGLGAAYQGLAPLVVWLLAAAVAESAIRLMSVEAQADGRPWLSTLAEAARLLILGAGVLSAALLGAAEPVGALVRWWALAAFAAAALQWTMARRR